MTKIIKAVPTIERDPVDEIMDPFNDKLTALLCDTAKELVDFYQGDNENRSDAALCLDQITKLMQTRLGGS